MVVNSTRVDSGDPVVEESRDSMRMDSRDSVRAESSPASTTAGKIRPEHEVLVHALKSLGYSAADAKERLVRALAHLAALGKEPREEEILRAALSRSLPRGSPSTVASRGGDG